MRPMRNWIMVLTSCPDGYLCLDIHVYTHFSLWMLRVSQTTCVAFFFFFLMNIFDTQLSTDKILFQCPQSYFVLSLKIEFISIDQGYSMGVCVVGKGKSLKWSNLSSQNFTFHTKHFTLNFIVNTCIGDSFPALQRPVIVIIVWVLVFSLLTTDHK